MKPGDRVCFARHFLRNTMQHTGDVPFAVGTVEEIDDYGDYSIVQVNWDNLEGHKSVNMNNLILADRKHLEKV